MSSGVLDVPEELITKEFPRIEYIVDPNTIETTEAPKVEITGTLEEIADLLDFRDDYHILDEYSLLATCRVKFINLILCKNPAEIMNVMEAAKKLAMLLDNRYRYELGELLKKIEEFIQLNRLLHSVNLKLKGKYHREIRIFDGQYAELLFLIMDYNAAIAQHFSLEA